MTSANRSVRAAVWRRLTFTDEELGGSHADLSIVWNDLDLDGRG